ncbi:MAG: hypothetical protein L0Y74_06340 [candidate division Zixibacteria bacterium]|nr:hypothetical protein [candidate division Zixibacteria bacterium]
MKKCTKCKTEKNDEEFYTRFAPDGTKVPVSWCKNCYHLNGQEMWKRKKVGTYVPKYHKKPKVEEEVLTNGQN